MHLLGRSKDDTYLHLYTDSVLWGIWENLYFTYLNYDFISDRAKDTKTNKVVALKKMRLNTQKDGKKFCYVMYIHLKKNHISLSLIVSYSSSYISALCLPGFKSKHSPER